MIEVSTLAALYDFAHTSLALFGAYDARTLGRNWCEDLISEGWRARTEQFPGELEEARLIAEAVGTPANALERCAREILESARDRWADKPLPITGSRWVLHLPGGVTVTENEGTTVK